MFFNISAARKQVLLLLSQPHLPSTGAGMSKPFEPQTGYGSWRLANPGAVTTVQLTALSLLGPPAGASTPSGPCHPPVTPTWAFLWHLYNSSPNFFNSKPRGWFSKTTPVEGRSSVQPLALAWFLSVKQSFRPQASCISVVILKQAAAQAKYNFFTGQIWGDIGCEKQPSWVCVLRQEGPVCYDPSVKVNDSEKCSLKVCAWEHCNEGRAC